MSVPPGVAPHHPSREHWAAAGCGFFWEATGFAICFQNHTDYDKLYTEHCLVLSWVRARGGGAESIRTLPSSAQRHTWPFTRSPSTA